MMLTNSAKKNKLEHYRQYYISSYLWTLVSRMARGQQKIQSQAKAAEKSAKIKKQQGHSANDQKKAAQKALVHVCTVCKVRIFVIYRFLEIRYRSGINFLFAGSNARS